MKTTKAQLKKIIPLYSDLTDLLLEFLEPCLDYDVAECTHKNTFCQCGNIFEFKINLINREKILLEKFCPFCGTENPHHSRIQMQPKSPYCDYSFGGGLALVRAKKHLGCPRCLKRAESYEHKFCSVCQHKLVAIVL